MLPSSCPTWRNEPEWIYNKNSFSDSEENRLIRKWRVVRNMSVSLKMLFFFIAFLKSVELIVHVDKLSTLYRHDWIEETKNQTRERSLLWKALFYSIARQIWKHANCTERSKTVGRDLFLLKQNMKHLWFIIGKMHSRSLDFPFQNHQEKMSNLEFSRTKC